MNFRQLIDAARCKGRADHLRPRTMMWVARVTDVSRPQIYNLINGSQTAPRWTVAKIARGLCVPAKKVEAALAASRAEYEVAS